MQHDLFPHLLPSPLDDDGMALVAAGILRDWFRALCYKHTEAAHVEILDSLHWQSTRVLFQYISISSTGRRGDFSCFANGIKQQARRARVKGLVMPCRRRGRVRVTRCGRTAELTGVGV